MVRPWYMLVWVANCWFGVQVEGEVVVWLFDFRVCGSDVEGSVL